jgi:hypothetical protein
MPNDLFKNREAVDRGLLTEIAEKHDTDPALLQKLIDYEQGRVHLRKRRGAKADIQRAIEEHIFDYE